MNKRAFTFVELSVMLAILGLVALIVIPSWKMSQKINRERNTVAPIEIKSNDRFDIQVVQQFEDYNAYTGKRNIYIIKDRTTNKEYIGINGIGIVENKF